MSGCFFLKHGVEDWNCETIFYGHYCLQPLWYNRPENRSNSVK